MKNRYKIFVEKSDSELMGYILINSIGRIIEIGYRNIKDISNIGFTFNALINFISKKKFNQIMEGITK